MAVSSNLTRIAAHAAIRTYQLTLSGLIGRQCRHWPSCSEYADEAIQRHGLWAGSWIGLARICRCGPRGTQGIDLVCEELPKDGHWATPWRYGRWRGVNAPPSENSDDQRLRLDSALISRGDRPDLSSDAVAKP